MLINDLKDLEQNGLILRNATEDIKVVPFVSCIAGDNLGSQYLGGFTEKFSKSKYLCRYCEVERSDFEENPLSKGIKRNLIDHREHAKV